MANPWFRMYAEFATDPKVQMLSESDQRRLTMLFCLRCNDLVTLHDTEVCFLLRVKSSDWQQTKALFIERGFINDCNEIVNWDKRQFKSDTSKDRVNAYRDRKKQSSNNIVTLHERKSNALDTEQIQNRTEQNKEKKDNKGKLNYESYPEFIEFWNAYPNKDAKYKALESWVIHKPPIQEILNALVWQTQSKKWQEKEGAFVPMAATYLNQKRWQDERSAIPSEGNPF